MDSFKDIFCFNKMLTPKFISVIYAVTLVSTALLMIFSLSLGRIGGAVILLVVMVFSRMFFEFLIVSFQNNDYLRRIADALDKGGDSSMKAGIYGLRPDVESDVSKQDSQEK